MQPEAQRAVLRRNAAYRSLWLARVLSFAGEQLTVVALVLAVHDAYGQGWAVAGFLLAQAAPRTLGPLAGAVADRIDQRSLMRASEAGRAVVIATIAVLLPPLAVLLPLVALNATLTTFSSTAGRSVVPALVAEDDLGRANAGMATGMNAGLALGPAAGGLLAATVGVQGALLVDVATSLLAVALLTRLPRLAPEQVATSTLRSDTVEGIRFVFADRRLRALTTALFAGVGFAAASNVASVFLVRDELDGTAFEFGLVEAAWAVGMIAAAAALVRSRRQHDPRTLIVLGWAATGVGLVLAGVAPAVAVVVLGYLVGGSGNGLDNVGTETFIQRTVERRYLGRAIGGVYTGAFLGELVAFAAAGAVLGLLGPRLLFVCVGAGTVLVALALYRVLPRLRPTTLGDAPA